MFLNTPVLVNKSERDYIENHVKDGDFSWHLAPAQTIDPIDPRLADRASNTPFFLHILMEVSQLENTAGKVQGKDYGFFETIFLRWCNKNNINPKIIYRACLNYTDYSPGEFSVPHVDHGFSHNTWIMYLNTTDGASTIFFDDELRIVDSVEAQAYTCVAFSSPRLHAHYYAKETDYRIVVVFTWI